ncbi:hypothetical protein GFV16_00025 [Bacillus megaterium]|uniref:hypothetical protein n=1 Tax=Priestia megaterium TaxID=1404 RepID=UPI001292F15D|nr:hypothetical protein [Priestia megaterium]MQR84330.1 hypothetical protein [Priestia megaterium]
MKKGLVIGVIAIVLVLIIVLTQFNKDSWLTGTWKKNESRSQCDSAPNTLTLSKDSKFSASYSVGSGSGEYEKDNETTFSFKNQIGTDKVNIEKVSDDEMKYKLVNDDKFCYLEKQ